ncbi:hypothetical protein [Pseudomonas abietaniphila]|uniref:Uncharacterized protein n=1 Tax=Pseudomonas abietaniphila TaxID=89065 RepID=A0A1G8QUH0_9PSED|nr:hypothetical protein [Pseudomonas abietaniphila]SDJ08273.1 hypothetical protein SAMN05216605_12165 [Pseudomonas abietaniphila]
MSLNVKQNQAQSLQALLAAVNAHSTALDEKELPPDGHSYNELHRLVSEHLSAMLSKIEPTIEIDPHAGQTEAQRSSKTDPEGCLAVAKVVKAVFDRLSQSSLRALMETHTEGWREQLNGNAGSQAKVDQEMGNVALRCVENMVSSDRQYIKALLAPAAI